MMEQPLGKAGEEGTFEHLGRDSIMRRGQQLKTNALIDYNLQLNKYRKSPN